MSEGVLASGVGVGLGVGVARLEDERFVRGRGRYVDDLGGEGLHVVFVRSGFAHGVIEGVDVSAALALEGVVCVLTGADLVGVEPLRADMPGPGWQGSALFALARDRVRFVGEPVAAVVAVDAATAADGADLVVVDVTPLEAVVDVVAARSTEVRLHDGWRSNVFFEHEVGGGDVDAAFAAAAGVVRLELRNRRQVGLPLEPRACVAAPAGSGVTLWTSSQVPQMVRAGLARALGWPLERLRVVSPDVGGGFGVKQQLFAEEVVVTFLAARLRRTVRWVESSVEHLLASVHAREQYHVVEAAHDASGRVLGVRAEITVDCGAYSMFPSGAALDGETAAASLPGPYDLPNLSIRVRSVATNKCPVGPYRGVGRPAACFSIERVMDAVARETGLDPVEVRARNLIRAEQFPYRSATGVRYDSGDYHAVLERLCDAVDYPRLRASLPRVTADGRYVGVGIACFIEHNSFVTARRFVERGVPLDFEEEVAEVVVGVDGRVRVTLPTHNHGQGHETMAAQLVAAELGCPLEAVTTTFGDTDEVPQGIGTFNSRSVIVAGGAVVRAARRLRDLAVAAAAEMLGAHAGLVRFTPEGMVEFVDGLRSVSLGEISTWLREREDGTAAELPRVLAVRQAFNTDDALGTVANGAHLAVVSVDPELASVKVERYVAVEDCGTIINPLIVAGQTQGGVAQGIGGALLEEFVYDDDGQPLTANLADYVIPGAADVPRVELHHVVTPSPWSPHGAKGMAEGPTIPVGAVVAAAIDDALSPLRVPPVTETPITSERLHELLGRRLPVAS
jgi:carbon-monoxide dehydrogenase large subunit